MELHSLPVSGGNGLQEERSLIVIQGLTVYNKVSLFNQCNKLKSICQLTTRRREKKRAIMFDMYHFSMQKNFFSVKVWKIKVIVEYSIRTFSLT